MSGAAFKTQSRFVLNPFLDTCEIHSSSFCWPLLLEANPEEWALLLAKDFFYSNSVSKIKKLRKKFFFNFAFEAIASNYELKRLDLILENCLYKTIRNTSPELLPILLQKTEKMICNRTLSKSNELPEYILNKAYIYYRNKYIKIWLTHFIPKCIRTIAFFGAYILAYWMWRKNTPMPISFALKGWWIFLKEFFE